MANTPERLDDDNPMGKLGNNIRKVLNEQGCSGEYLLLFEGRSNRITYMSSSPSADHAIEVLNGALKGLVDGESKH